MELVRRQTTVVVTETIFQTWKSTDDIELTAAWTMLRDVMLPQENASHQNKARNGNMQQTDTVQETRSRRQLLERCCTVVCLLRSRITPRRGRKTETSQEPEDGAWNWSGGNRRLS